MLNRVVVGGQHWHICSLFQLFLLASVIIGNLKRHHKFVITDTALPDTNCNSFTYPGGMEGRVGLSTITCPRLLLESGHGGT